MTREQFMQKLEALLAPLSREERRDALDYYDEYFDAAGPEKEAETIAELGSPEEVARKILESQPQLPTPMDANRQNTPLPPDQPRRRSASSTNWTLRWIGLGVVVMILIMYLFQHSSARRVTTQDTTEPLVSSGTAQETSLDDDMALNESDSVTYIPLDRLKHLTLDLDAGSVTFVQGRDASEASVRFQNKDANAQLTTHFSASGSTISYSLPNGHLNLKDDKFLVTITLPADFEMESLDVDFDMGSLTLGSLHVKELNADLDMGSCTADTLTCSTADIELDMGSFTADAVTAKDFTAESSMGSVTIGSLTSEETELYTDMGSLTVGLTGSESDYAIDAEVDMGKLTINGRTVSSSYSSRGRYPIQLTNNMGSITVEFVK